jgi:hypothetical protein
LANQPAVTGATYIPSLLESSDIELARYLWYGTTYTFPL